MHYKCILIIKNFKFFNEKNDLLVMLLSLNIKFTISINDFNFKIEIKSLEFFITYYIDRNLGINKFPSFIDFCCSMP